MIVVDTNVIAYLLIAGDHTEAARDAYARDADWCAPLLWRSELRNVLALYLRNGSLTLREAVAVQEAAESLLAGREYHVASGEVLGLAAQSGRSAYDCEFVAVARQLGVPLVTSDRQLLRSFPKVAQDVEAFGSGPADV
jgi:predicted nucleic acid-binding protein